MPIAGDVDGLKGAVIIPLASRARNGHPAIDTTRQAVISFALRQMYGNLVELPLPERLVELLARLDHKQPEGS
jgi:hypothetical protein